MPADPQRGAASTETESEPATTSDAAGGTTSRRRLLSSAAVGSATALAGCAELMGSADALRVCVWSGHYADDFEAAVVPQYEEEFDAELTVERGWGEILNEIQEAPEDDPPYDVTVTEGNFYHYGRQADLFEPIREENVPNADDVMEFYRDVRTTEYGMPVDGSPCTIIHREDVDVEFDDWSVLGSEAVDDSAGIGVDTGFWWYPLYAAALGMDEAEGADEMHDGDLHDDVLEEFASWNVEGWAESGEDIWQQFENGVIDVGQWYYDSVAYDVDDYEGLTHTMPEETPGWFNNWCVVEGTDRRDEAEEFINFLMDSDVQSEWAEHAALAFSNENVEYPDEIADDLPTTNEEASNFVFPDWGELADHDDELDDEVSDVRQDG